MQLENGSVLHWNMMNAQCLRSKDEQLNFKHIDSIFNDQDIYYNAQIDGRVDHVSYDIAV